MVFVMAGSYLAAPQEPRIEPVVVEAARDRSRFLSALDEAVHRGRRLLR